MDRIHIRGVVILVASTLPVMAGAIIAPALPAISRHFSAVDNGELLSKLILTLPALFTAVLAPVAGLFTDSMGRKRVLSISLILFAIAGTSGAYLTDIYWILAGRAFLGVAVAALMTSVVTLIGDYYAGAERSRMMGHQAAYAGIGGMLFISLGGWLTDIHWRAPFLIYSFSLVVLLFSWIYVTEPKLCKRWKSKNNGRALIFIDIPQQVLWVYLLAFISMAIFYMIPVQMPFMLSAMEGISNTQVGVAIAFMNVSAVTMALNYGRVKSRLSYIAVMAMVYFFVAVGYIIISRGGSYWMIVAGILVSGAGFGMQMANLNLWLVSLAPPSMRGRFVGYLNAIIFLGMFLSPVMLQPLINLTSLYQSFFYVGCFLLIFAGLFVVKCKPWQVNKE